MIFLGSLEKIEEGKYSVGLQHFMPEMLLDEVKATGILVESLPEDMTTEGKFSKLYCNPSTRGVWYEYEDIPKTQEELLREELDNQINYNIDLDYRLSKIELGL